MAHSASSVLSPGGSLSLLDAVNFIGSFWTGGALGLHDSLLRRGALRLYGSFWQIGAVVQVDSLLRRGPLRLYGSFLLAGALVDLDSLLHAGALHVPWFDHVHWHSQKVCLTLRSDGPLLASWLALAHGCSPGSLARSIPCGWLGGCGSILIIGTLVDYVSLEPPDAVDLNDSF